MGVQTYSHHCNLNSCNSTKAVKDFKRVTHVICIPYAKMLANHSSGHLQCSLTADTPLKTESSNQRAKTSVENNVFLFLNYDYF